MRDNGQYQTFSLDTTFTDGLHFIALLFYLKVLLLIFISRPLPPWYLQQPSLHSNSDFWLQNSASARHSDLSVGGSDASSSGSDTKSSYNSRIPILVATTTEPPRRIPITITTPTTTTTTPEPETTSSTTPETVPTTEATSKEADVLLHGTNEVVINHELGEG